MDKVASWLWLRSAAIECCFLSGPVRAPSPYSSAACSHTQIVVVLARDEFGNQQLAANDSVVVSVEQNQRG